MTGLLYGPRPSRVHRGPTRMWACLGRTHHHQSVMVVVAVVASRWIHSCVCMQRHLHHTGMVVAVVALRWIRSSGCTHPVVQPAALEASEKG
eukprot:1147819-Pelagomonas_calceolata.AAC.2